MLNLLSLSDTGAAFGEQFNKFIDFVKGAFLEFSVIDAIDIFLLTALFFVAYRYLRKKKAGALIVGIVICLAVLVLSTAFELTGMRFILSGVFQIGALALVIIFQPELRELLETLGSGSLKGIRSFGQDSKNKQKQYQTIKNISKAVHILCFCHICGAEHNKLFYRD